MQMQYNKLIIRYIQQQVGKLAARVEKTFLYDYPGVDNAPQNIIDIRRKSIEDRFNDLKKLLQ